MGDRTALVATVTVAYQGRGSNKSVGVAGGGGGCYQSQSEANRWERECDAERGKEWKEGEEKDVTGAQVNWAHAPFLHLHPQLPVPSLSLSTTFVFAGASIIKITSSLFITTVVEQLRLVSSPMADGVSVQGPATCCIQREGSSWRSSYTPLFTARRQQSCTLSKQAFSTTLYNVSFKLLAFPDTAL